MSSMVSCRASTQAAGQPLIYLAQQNPLLDPNAQTDPPMTLAKAPTGIAGLDEITGGGLPRGRTTLVLGGAGSGKTLLGTKFLVRGALEFGEPGVFIAFEETASDLAVNVRSLGYDLDALVEDELLFIDHIRVERSEIEETGSYDLEGLFIRLHSAIETVGAKRLVIDSLEVLFGSLRDHGILRAELRRLFRWLGERGMTSIVTSERGPDNQISRHGLEEYVSDCVLLLDHRIENQISTRRLRILKYRGSHHGADEYPFLIDEDGIEVYPITSLGLSYQAPDGHVATGIAGLDSALCGRGFPRGSSVLITGSAGTGKTSIAASIVDSACARGERCLYFSMEESHHQIIRNMRSIGIDFAPWVEQGLLQIVSSRPTYHGLEMHLASIYRAASRFEPEIIVMDPISGFDAVGTDIQVTAAITRMLDYFKAKDITAFFTSLTANTSNFEQTEVGVSSWVDAWIQLQSIQTAGRRHRSLYIIKVRGMAHSDEVLQMQFSSDGLRVEPLETADQ